MSKMDELKAAVTKISEVLGYEIDQMEVRLKPTSKDAAKVMPNGERALRVDFSKAAANRIKDELIAIGMNPYNRFDLDGGRIAQDYTLGNIKVSTWYCDDPEDRITVLEAELAKLREQEVIQ